MQAAPPAGSGARAADALQPPPPPRAAGPQTYQGGWATDKGACEQCMCVRLHGGDDKYNTGLQTEPLKKNMGLTFLARVGDRCGEW